MMKLNLGSNKVKIPGFDNVDIKKFDGVKHVCDISRLPFKENTVDCIYASHCLEHFPYTRIPEILKGWHKVLKPGKKLYLAVPDWDAIVKYYTTTKLFNDMLINLIWGGQKDKYDFHYIALSYPKALFLLDQAGFVNIERVEKMPFGNDCSTLYDKLLHINLSLNICAQK